MKQLNLTLSRSNPFVAILGDDCISDDELRSMLQETIMKARSANAASAISLKDLIDDLLLASAYSDDDHVNALREVAHDMQRHLERVIENFRARQRAKTWRGIKPLFMCRSAGTLRGSSYQATDVE